MSPRRASSPARSTVVPLGEQAVHPQPVVVARQRDRRGTRDVEAPDAVAQLAQVREERRGPEHAPDQTHDRRFVGDGERGSEEQQGAESATHVGQRRAKWRGCLRAGERLPLPSPGGRSAAIAGVVFLRQSSLNQSICSRDAAGLKRAREDVPARKDEGTPCEATRDRVPLDPGHHDGGEGSHDQQVACVHAGSRTSLSWRRLLRRDAGACGLPDGAVDSPSEPRSSYIVVPPVERIGRAPPLSCSRGSPRRQSAEPLRAS